MVYQCLPSTYSEGSFHGNNRSYGFWEIDSYPTFKRITQTFQREDSDWTLCIRSREKVSIDARAKGEGSENTRVRDLTEEELGRIREAVEAHTVEGDLRREVSLNIKRLIEIGSYRGIRHRRSLPVRGQNSKNNARTRKGPRRTVANKKK